MLVFQIPAPAPDGAAMLRQETDVQIFRKEQFSFTRYYYEGQVTRQRFTTPALDELHVSQVYNQYREKYKFMFPEQLIRMRERYGLTAARMALLLDIGPNQYSNYEAGEVPSASNARILRLASDPTTFLGIVRDKREELRPTEYEKLRRHIDALLDAQTSRRTTNLSVAPTVFVTETDPDQYTGYVLPSPEKFAELVLYFFGHLDNLFKVKLLKLLFYCDFQHYRVFGRAITGQRYRAIKHGPVPQEYGQRLQEMVQQDLLQASFHSSLIHSSDGSPVLVHKATRAARLEVFNDTERQIIQQVFHRLGRKTRVELENLSHTERAWQENNAQHGQISYQFYAFDLQSLPLGQ